MDEHASLPMAMHYLHLIPPVCQSLKPSVYQKMKDRAEKEIADIALLTIGADTEDVNLQIAL